MRPMKRWANQRAKAFALRRHEADFDGIASTPKARPFDIDHVGWGEIALHLKMPMRGWIATARRSLLRGDRGEPLFQCRRSERRFVVLAACRYILIARRDRSQLALPGTNHARPAA